MRRQTLPAFALKARRFRPATARPLLQTDSCVHPPCDPITVNKYINPVSDLNGGSGNGLQLDWAHADALPLSAAQLGIWFAQRIDPSASTYNIGEYIEIDGSMIHTVRASVRTSHMRNGSTGFAIAVAGRRAMASCRCFARVLDAGYRCQCRD